METKKDSVRSYWEKAACGENLYLQGATREDFSRQAETRYRLEPYIPDFARFDAYANKRVLEVGVGLGADHQRFAQAGARLYGIDLTRRSIDLARRRFQTMGLESNIFVGDAENLPFPENTFDLVYCWGAIHHSPDTSRAATEILRVLKKGGEFKVMIYHKFSCVGYMLWLRYALLRLRPFVTLDEIYGAYLESPGTKAYTVDEGRKLFAGATRIDIRTQLTHGDLLSSNAGQRHRSAFLTVAKAVWPRSAIRFLLKNHGLFMLIHGVK